MRERDESRHLAVGAGAPSDPDIDGSDRTERDDVADEDQDRGPFHPNGRDENGDDAAEARTTGDVVQAVAEFLDDLVDDPTFAHDPRRPGEP